jgi:hypothetical protein
MRARLFFTTLFWVGSCFMHWLKISLIPGFELVAFLLV